MAKKQPMRAPRQVIPKEALYPLQLSVMINEPLNKALEALAQQQCLRPSQLARQILAVSLTQAGFLKQNTAPQG